MNTYKKTFTAIAGAAVIAGLTLTAAPASAASWEEGFHGTRPVVCPDGTYGDERIRTGQITCDSDALDGNGKPMGNRASKVDQTHITVTNGNTGESYVWVTGLTEAEAAAIRQAKNAGAGKTTQTFSEAQSPKAAPKKTKVTHAKASAIATKAATAAKNKITKINSASLKSAKTAAAKAAKSEASKIATKSAAATKVATEKAKSTKATAKKAALKAKAKIKKSASAKVKNNAYTKAYKASVKATANKAHSKKYTSTYKKAYSTAYNKALTANKSAKLKAAKKTAYTKAYNVAYAKAIKG